LLAWSERDAGMKPLCAAHLEVLIPWLEAQTPIDWGRLTKAVLIRGYAAHEDPPEAIRWYQRAASMAQEHLPPTNPWRIESRSLQALLLRDQGRLDEAAEIYRTLLADLRQTLTVEDDALSREWTHFARILSRSGRHAEATEEIQTLISAMLPHFDEDHPSLLMAQAARLNIMLASGHAAEVLPLAEKQWRLTASPSMLPARVLAATCHQAAQFTGDPALIELWSMRRRDRPVTRTYTLRLGLSALADPLLLIAMTDGDQVIAVLADTEQMIEHGYLRVATDVLNRLAGSMERTRQPPWIRARAEAALAKVHHMQNHLPEARRHAHLARAAMANMNRDLPWLQSYVGAACTDITPDRHMTARHMPVD